MVYLDNDCLITLAELNLLQFFCKTYELPDKWSVTILRECIYQIDKVRGERAKGDFREFCSKQLPASEDWAPDEYEIVCEFSDAIHEEAILIASCLKDGDEASLITGDINAIKAFAKNGPEAIVKSLHGRVRLREHVILDIISAIDPEQIYRALRDSTCEHRTFREIATMSLEEMSGYLGNKSTERPDYVQALFPPLT